MLEATLARDLVASQSEDDPGDNAANDGDACASIDRSRPQRQLETMQRTRSCCKQQPEHGDARSMTLREDTLTCVDELSKKHWEG